MKTNKLFVRTAAVALALSAAASLSACGYSRGDRALSGAALGAGVGAAGSALTGGNALGGAALGGAVGAGAGYLSSPRDVNLGRPAWR